MAKERSRKRGRPPKFGRAAQLISLTLPRDVINWLKTLDDDLAWAIVKLFERSTKNRTRQVEIAQLVRFPGDAALILVRPELFQGLPGVSLIQLADGRAFLALSHGKGVADLELIVVDRLESKAPTAAERLGLTELRAALRRWRQEGIEFESRSVIVARAHKRRSYLPD
jgi:hypothetical protein